MGEAADLHRWKAVKACYGNDLRRTAQSAVYRLQFASVLLLHSLKARIA